MSVHPIERHCPKCDAEPGRPCVGSRGYQRKAYHRERGSRRALVAIAEHGHRTDSPIEEALAAIVAGWIDHHDVEGVTLATQVPVGPYRADIMIEVAGHRLVVEADGSRYHNTADAIAHDKRRDRFFLLQGIAVMRFTGAEIARDPRGCAAEIGLWIRANR